MDFTRTDNPLFNEDTLNLINTFCNLCRREITLTEITPVMYELLNTPLLRFLANNPTSKEALACMNKAVYDYGTRIPSDFLRKFLTMATVKIHIVPSNYFTNQSFTARVIVDNIKPAYKLTELKARTMGDRLKEDVKTFHFYDRSVRIPVQTLKLKMDEELLNSCVNAIADLNDVIVEGNRQNGYDMCSFINNQIINN